MTEAEEFEREDAFAGEEPKASAAILAALKRAEREFRDWQTTCDTIDEIYGREGSYGGIRRELDEYGWQDSKLDLFWASYEVLKPAVYARPPRPAVKPLFSDNRRLQNVTAELLERTAISTFMRTGIDDVMQEVRDDVLFTGRGVPWLRYEADDDGQRVCVEHKDRKDFRHEPARKWAEVGWVAAGEWLTKRDMRKRFRKHSGDAYQGAHFTVRRDDDSSDGSQSLTRKAQVWEVWHKADNKVYWVTEGVDVLLDSGEPHLKLSGFFPCPKPAYATLRRRSLVPVPDWERYAVHFRKISDLTGRIYLLLDSVRMKGLIPAGGDVGSAIEQLIASDDDQILIPVPGAALLASGTGGMNGFVQWLPLAELAAAITGLIEARGQLISDFYELSGISDIMRGATEAEETLGAQQLKSQYGSVRVRCKIDELQRVAADSVKIAAEIIAEKFSKDTLLEMAQMDVPTKADIEKRIKEVERGAEAELKQLGDKAQKMAAQQQGADPAEAQAMLSQAQQQILAKYAPMLAEAESQVPLEDVMKLLRDDKARSFAFEIETDSTILTDELQEKASRNEFMTVFTNASQGLMGMAAMGEQGAKLAGEMMKFVLAPYRAGRQLDSAIDAFIEAAPEMAAAAAGQEGEGEDLAEANKLLADAEMEKAKAAMASVEARAALDKAEMQRKMLEMQQKAQESQFKAAAEAEKLRQAMTAEQAKSAHIEAQINKLTAETAAILTKIGLDARQQELAEYQAAQQTEAQQFEQQARTTDQAMAAEGQKTETQFRERGEERADRQQTFTEKTALSDGGQ